MIVLCGPAAFFSIPNDFKHVYMFLRKRDVEVDGGWEGTVDAREKAPFSGESAARHPTSHPDQELLELAFVAGRYGHERDATQTQTRKRER